MSNTKTTTIETFLGEFMLAPGEIVTRIVDNKVEEILPYWAQILSAKDENGDWVIPTESQLNGALEAVRNSAADKIRNTVGFKVTGRSGPIVMNDRLAYGQVVFADGTIMISPEYGAEHIIDADGDVGLAVPLSEEGKKKFHCIVKSPAANGLGVVQEVKHPGWRIESLGEIPPAKKFAGPDAVKAALTNPCVGSRTKAANAIGVATSPEVRSAFQGDNRLFLLEGTMKGMRGHEIVGDATDTRLRRFTHPAAALVLNSELESTNWLPSTAEEWDKLAQELVNGDKRYFGTELITANDQVVEYTDPVFPPERVVPRVTDYIGYSGHKLELLKKMGLLQTRIHKTEFGVDGVWVCFTHAGYITGLSQNRDSGSQLKWNYYIPPTLAVEWTSETEFHMVMLSGIDLLARAVQRYVVGTGDNAIKDPGTKGALKAIDRVTKTLGVQIMHIGPRTQHAINACKSMINVDYGTNDPEKKLKLMELLAPKLGICPCGNKKGKSYNRHFKAGKGFRPFFAKGGNLVKSAGNQSQWLASAMCEESLTVVVDMTPGQMLATPSGVEKQVIPNVFLRKKDDTEGSEIHVIKTDGSIETVKLGHRPEGRKVGKLIHPDGLKFMLGTCKQYRTVDGENVDYLTSIHEIADKDCLHLLGEEITILVDGKEVIGRAIRTNWHRTLAWSENAPSQWKQQKARGTVMYQILHAMDMYQALYAPGNQAEAPEANGSILSQLTNLGLIDQKERKFHTRDNPKKWDLVIDRVKLLKALQEYI